MRTLRMIAVLAVVAVLGIAGLPRQARADQSGGHTVSVAVLAFDSDDAEEQADAFTGAMRSRVRAAQGWSLIETSQSLGMLTAALKCPARPTPECQQRIGEQLKVDRYVWGHVARGPAAQVTAEVHLYQKGKPDTVIKESYAETLKDQNDDTLRKIAQRVLERLAGSAVGVLVVRAPTSVDGEVVVDGEKRVPLQSGAARLELAPGSHSVEILPTTGAATKRNVLVSAGKESVVEVDAPAPVPTGTPEKPFPTSKVVGGIALGTGVALGAVAVQQFLLYGDLQDRGDRIATRVPKDEPPCGGNFEDKEFCDTDKKARTASAISIAAAGVGAVAVGTGIYLLFIASDGPSERAPTSAKPKTRLVPTFGTTGGGFAVTGSF